MKKTASLLFALFLAAALLVALGRLFVSSVGGERPPEAAGVVLSAPPDALVRQAGPLSAADAARALAALATESPGRPRVAVDTVRDGARVLLVLDREAGTIEELRSSTAGTRVSRLHAGSIDARLARAREAGSFEGPGLAPPVEKNLYH